MARSSTIMAQNVTRVVMTRRIFVTQLWFPYVLLSDDENDGGKCVCGASRVPNIVPLPVHQHRRSSRARRCARTRATFSFPTVGANISSLLNSSFFLVKSSHHF